MQSKSGETLTERARRLKPGETLTERARRLKPGETLTECARRLKPGETLELEPGKVYHETLFMRTGGTAEKPIVIKGNGAVLSGLLPIPDDSWQDKGDGLFLSANNRSWGAHDPQAYDANGTRLTPDVMNQRETDPRSLAPGRAVWRSDGLWYRSPDGRPPRHLFGTMLGEGVNFDKDANYIVVENLTCEYVSNDGFNVHGSCRGLVFRNITGRFCGDEGISVHEDVSMSVYHGNFHHCGNGFTDICASQSAYFDCVSASNRYFGAQFDGGHHTLVDCTFIDNPAFQLRFAGGHIAASYNFPSNSPALKGSGYLKNVRFIGNAPIDLEVRGHAEVHADGCTFSKPDTGLRTSDGGQLSLSAPTK